MTSFGYAYLAAASLVSVTAFSIGLVSSVPLTRIGLGEGAVARHVTSSAWVALTLIGAAVGAFAVAGGDDRRAAFSATRTEATSARRSAG